MQKKVLPILTEHLNCHVCKTIGNEIIFVRSLDGRSSLNECDKLEICVSKGFEVVQRPAEIPSVV